MPEFHILVVEDNPADVELLRIAMQEVGLDCSFTTFDDGTDAIHFVQQHLGTTSPDSTPNLPIPNLAIVDLNLPRNDGLEVVEHMRANPNFAAVPVMIFSSSSLPRERSRMEELRVMQHVPKPTDLDGLLRVGELIKAILYERASRTAAFE